MTRVIVPPAVVELDGARVYILEVTERTWIRGEKRFLVTCMIEYAGYCSPKFTLDVASNEELKAKLQAEIAKMKLAILSGRGDAFFNKC
ncbi:MAG: hypothetical protein DRJ38_03540 [Thermoprotei archaeon]|nr:MAG: hypothetical protein DRJ38_03540 [Thermoprotei archaeon]